MAATLSLVFMAVKLSLRFRSCMVPIVNFNWLIHKCHIWVGCLFVMFDNSSSYLHRLQHLVDFNKNLGLRQAATCSAGTIYHSGYTSSPLFLLWSCCTSSALSKSRPPLLTKYISFYIGTVCLFKTFNVVLSLKVNIISIILLLICLNEANSK